VFVLTELEGMTAPEVAEALGIPLGTAYSRLRTAWQVLGRHAGREQQRLRRALPTMRAPDPSPERRRQMWGLVAGGLRLPADGGAGAAAVTGWLAQVKWLAVGAALGAGLLGARAATVASRSGSVEPTKRSRAAEDPAEKIDAANPSAASRASATVDAVPPSQPAASAIPGVSASTTPASPSSGAVPSTRAPAPSTPAVAVDAPADDALAAELGLLRSAREALRDGRADDALAWLDEHARRFPRGQLVDERRALEVEAGRSEGAR
jgi:hypothetical protein